MASLPQEPRVLALPWSVSCLCLPLAALLPRRAPGHLYLPNAQQSGGSGLLSFWGQRAGLCPWWERLFPLLDIPQRAPPPWGGQEGWRAVLPTEVFALPGLSERWGWAWRCGVLSPSVGRVAPALALSKVGGTKVPPAHSRSSVISVSPGAFLPPQKSQKLGISCSQMESRQEPIPETEDTVSSDHQGESLPGGK